jgi:hypothetical protein
MISYLALVQIPPPSTKEHMGHTGDDMIFRHDRTAVPPATAAKYWQLKPEEIEGFDD